MQIELNQQELLSLYETMALIRLSEERLQRLGAGQLAGRLDEDVGQLIVVLRVQGIALLGEVIDEGGAADVAPLFVRLHHALPLQHRQVLADPRRGEVQIDIQLLDRCPPLPPEVVDDLLSGRLHKRSSRCYIIAYRL